MSGGHAGESLAVSDALGQFASVVLLELGLVVHELKLRWAAGLEQVDDPFGHRRKVGLVVADCGAGDWVLGGRRSVSLGSEQLRKRDGPDRRVFEERSS